MTKELYTKKNYMSTLGFTLKGTSKGVHNHFHAG